ncbi:hypothetical protein ACFLZ6_00010 [Nanoarchaeota archaeon]
MAKAYGKCVLCGADSFLNYAGLCKRCNSKKESSSIKKEILHDQELDKESKKKEQAAMPETKVETKEVPAEEVKEEKPAEESKEKAEDKKE